MNHSQMFVRGKSNWHGEAGISSKVWRIPYLADAAHLPTKHPCLRRRHRSTASDTAEAYSEIITLANQLLLLRTATPYKELGEDYLDERRRGAPIRYHTKRLHELGASA